MKAGETNIESLIEGKKQYLVPLFQRAYVWNKKHWQVLWDDLMDLYTPYEDKHNETHFFGSFVTLPIKENDGVKEFLLIDGQQRLTTLFILLAALRNESKKDEETKGLPEEINQAYLFNVFNENRPKLLPTELQGDKDCLKKILCGEKCTINNRINDSFLFFSKSVDKKSFDLKRLTRIITNALRIVHIELAEGDDAYKIFEGLNAKGAELSQADLIRNYFFMHINNEQVEETYKTYWKPIQEKLGDSLSEYMRHFLMKDGVMVKKNDVYFTLKKRIDRLKKISPEEVVGLLKDLAQFAGFYEKLLNPEREQNLKIREYLARLNQIGFTISYPFLLTVYADYENQQGFSENQFLEVLKLLDNFSVRRSICQVATSPLNRVFIHLHKNSSKQSDFVKGVKIELSKKQYPSDIQFIEDLKTTQLDKKREKSRQKIHFILWRLESFENKTSVNFERHTIEHILPEELTPEWKKQLGKEQQNIDQSLVNTIGNLTLLESNPKQLAKSNFSKKQKFLKKSHLHLNKYFLNLNRWDEESIKERTEYLTHIALKIWPYFGEEQTDFLAHDVKGKKPTKVIIMGDSYVVSSWRDVMHNTLETIIVFDAETFDQIIKEFPQYVAWENKFRSSRQLSNGVYIETNMDARSIYQFCREVAEFSGFSSDDFQVKWI